MFIEFDFAINKTSPQISHYQHDTYDNFHVNKIFMSKIQTNQPDLYASGPRFTNK